MSLFGALVRTVVNVAILPVTLPVAIAKDAGDFLSGEVPGDNLKKVAKDIKDEAEP